MRRTRSRGIGPPLAGQLVSRPRPRFGGRHRGRQHPWTRASRSRPSTGYISRHPSWRRSATSRPCSPSAETRRLRRVDYPTETGISRTRRHAEDCSRFPDRASRRWAARGSTHGLTICTLIATHGRLVGIECATTREAWGRTLRGRGQRARTVDVRRCSNAEASRRGPPGSQNAHRIAACALHACARTCRPVGG